MRPILYTIVNILFDYLIILLAASAATGIIYMFNPAINIIANTLTTAILVVIIDAFRARIMEEYRVAKSFLK